MHWQYSQFIECTETSARSLFLGAVNGTHTAHRIRTLASGTKFVFLTEESSAGVVQEALPLRGPERFVLTTSYGEICPYQSTFVLDCKGFVSNGQDAKPP